MASVSKSNFLRAREVAAITPADSNLARPADALYIEVAGDINVYDAAGNSSVIAVPDNFILPVYATAVYNTSTTATGIFALYE